MEINKSKLEKIRKKHNLSLIILHGSQVDKKIHPKSDVDIAVVRKNRKKNLQLFSIIKDLTEAIDNGNVDISDLTNADPLFLFATTKKSQLLAGSKNYYDALVKLAFHKYNDYLPYLEKEREHVIKKIKSYVTT